MRFRTLGCYPLSGAIESAATTVDEIVAETAAAAASERQGRLIDSDQPARWRRRSGRATSERVAAAPDHLRQRGRWQVDADRPAAVRVAGGVRGPAARARSRLAPLRHAGHAPRFRAAGGWPAGRARAGHHHRRRLPLLRHAGAALHRRRHARPRAVHAQHGHRRLDRGPGDHPDRRAQGRAAAVPPPHPHRRDDGHPARAARRQQDGPGRLRASRSTTPSSTSTRAFAAAVRRDGGAADSDLGARRRQPDRAEPADALVRRADGDELPRERRGRRARRRPARSGCRCRWSTARARTSAASPAASAWARCIRAIACACCRRASRPASPPSSRWTGPAAAPRPATRSR